MNVLIVGCGWLGMALGRALVARGDHVVGVRRSPSACAELTSAGIEPLVLDVADPDAARAIPGEIGAVVVCAAPREGSVVAYRRAYVDLNRVTLNTVRDHPISAYVYTGSTGVFGQGDGEIVDEKTPVAPAHEAARVLVAAERIVLDAASREGLPTRVVRLSGLYGPGRLGVIERVRAGRLALGAGDETWTNWCHRDDAVMAVIAALDRGSPDSVYHASDARPVRRRDVVRYVAARLGIEPPQSVVATSRVATRPDRRISSERTRRELGFELRYPSIREGLAPHLPSTATGS